MKEVNKAYNIPQDILYSVCIAAWNLCREHLNEFADLKAFYTEAYIDNALLAVQSVKQRPNLKQTIAERKQARTKLVNAARKVQANWQVLKLYITRAFDKEMADIMLEAAGAGLYAKASLCNWSAVRNLIALANSFIADNMETLTANENMPASFQARFQSDGENCENLSIVFCKIDMEKEKTTSNRKDANNAIYLSAIEMLKDGQQIFRNNAALKRQFIFRYLISLYKNEGAASLKGHVVTDLNQPIEGVTITSKDQKYTATTNAKGYYRINRIAEGTYTFILTYPGYSPLEQAITFSAGIAVNANFKLENFMKKAA
jgi:carboxypeptidase family protein